MAGRSRGGSQSIWEDLQADWDSAVAEFGADLSGHWIGDWMEKHSLHELIGRRGFTGFVAKAVAKLPDQLRAPFFFFLGGLVEHWNGPQNLHPSLHAAFTATKFGLAAFLKQVPDVVQDKINKGEIDPDNIEIGIFHHLNYGWPRITAILSTNRAMHDAVHTGALVAAAHPPDDHSKKDDTDKKAGGGTHVHVDPKAAASAAATLDELKYGREQEEKARMRLVAMTREQRRSLGLYQRILNLYFRRDTGPAPNDVFTMNRLLRYVKYCEAAIGSLPTEIPNFDLVQRNLRTLESHQRNLDARQDEEDMREDREDEDVEEIDIPEFDAAAIEALEEPIRDVLDQFQDFEAMLIVEATPLLGGFERVAMSARDWLNDRSTPESRALWRRRFRRLQRSWAWPIIAAILAAIGFFIFFALPAIGGVVTLGASITTVLSIMGAAFGLLAWSMPEFIHVGFESFTTFDLGTVAARIFNYSVLGIVASRVLVTVGDRSLEVIRAMGDFLDPTDGTGVIGGSFASIGDALRWWGPLPPKTDTQIAAEIERRKNRDNITVVKGVVTTITIGAAVLALIANALFMGYGDLTVVPSLAICLVIVLYFEAEFFTRSRTIVTALYKLYLINDEQRREAAATVVKVASAGAGVLTVSLLIALLMFGPRNADNALKVSQHAGGQMVASVYASVDPACAAGVQSLYTSAREMGMTVDEICRLAPVPSCDCPR